MSEGLAVPDGIAIDWVAKRVYFAESFASRIDVTTYDGGIRCSLISSNLSNPRGLALDPREGYLFITDWGGDASLFRSQMDGSNLVKLTSEQIGWPNGITIDYITKRVYWIDAKYDYIDSIRYDGTGRVNLIKGKSYVTHPFALTMDDSFIYFTDWKKKGIVRVSKAGNTDDYKVIIENLNRPMDIQVMSKSRQPNSTNPCEASNAPKCQDLCVIKSNGTAACLCKIGSMLASNGVSCEKINKFLIFARSWEIRGISLNTTFKHDVITPVLGLSSAVGTDFDAYTRYVYFSDIKNNKIGRVKNSSIEWIHTTNLENPDGLAVDWIGKNLYWTDAKVNGHSEIGVSKLNGQFRRTLYKKGLGKPRAIVVDPNRGFVDFLFFILLFVQVLGG